MTWCSRFTVEDDFVIGVDDLGYLVLMNLGIPASGLGRLPGVISVGARAGERGVTVAEDWDAVARVVDARLLELGIQQLELHRRSRVATSTIREIRYNTRVRRRSSRTQALSEALEWEPDHLSAILSGESPRVESSSDLQRIRESLDSLHLRLDDVSHRVDSNDRVLRELVTKVDGLHRALTGDRNATR